MTIICTTLEAVWAFIVAVVTNRYLLIPFLIEIIGCIIEAKCKKKKCRL